MQTDSRAALRLEEQRIVAGPVKSFKRNSHVLDTASVTLGLGWVGKELGWSDQA